MALDAARRRLALHHGGGGSGVAALAMPQRRGGGGGGGGGNGNGGGGNADSLLRRGLRELLDKVDRATAAGGRGDGGGNGGGGDRRGSRGREGTAGTGGRGGNSGAERRPQAGDWACTACNFAANFARRRECFVCKRPRSPPRAGGRGAAAGHTNPTNRGPVGAWGNRPLLGGASSAKGGKGSTEKGGDVAPTFRVPGASVAARASAMPASGGAGGGKGAGVGLGGTAIPPAAAETPGGTDATDRSRAGEIDEDGFQRVVRRGGRRGDEVRATEGGAARGTDVAPSGARTECDTTGAPAGASGGSADGADEGATLTPEELHKAWMHEVGLVRKLRQQGVQGGHPALRAACEARDAAEQAWRRSKDPAPASVRLGRAQEKLDRAIALQAEARQAIVDAELAHSERMATLRAAMDECAERVRRRRGQLREVQVEVGAGGVADGGGPQARAQQAAIRQVHRTIVGDVGPTIAALVEQIDSSAPAWAALNGLLGKLSASQAALEGACTRQGADHFDMCGGDHGDDDDRCDARSDWSEDQDLYGQAWRDGGSGRRDGAADDHGDGATRLHGGCGDTDHYDDDADDFDDPMETGDWWGTPSRRWGDRAHWRSSGHGKWSRASWADQSEGAPMGHEEDDTGPPPPARRRLEGTASEQGDGTAHGGPRPAAASVQADDPEAQKQRYAQRLEQIICMSVAAGVNPVTDDGEDLRMLGPHQLDEWVAAKLPSALLC